MDIKFGFVVKNLTTSHANKSTNKETSCGDSSMARNRKIKMYCGLDFGTSNSVISVMRNNKISLVPLDNNSAILPSTVFFDYEDNTACFGKKAIEKYINGTEGRLISAIKSILGTSLQDEGTLIKGRTISFQEIISLLLTHVKEKAEIYSQESINKVVIGRPVHFSDSSKEEDIKAENILRKICNSVGFREVVFQLEPIAALNSVITTNTHELKVLVIDIGGGTSDFSIAIKPTTKQNNRILANTGVHIGGVDFDRLLTLKKIMPLLGYGTSLGYKNLPFPNHFFVSLSDWSKVNFFYNKKILYEIDLLAKQSTSKEKIDRLLKVIKNKLGHELLLSTEQAKIKLSTNKHADVNLSYIEPELIQSISQEDLEHSIASLLTKIDGSIKECLNLSGLNPKQIEAILFTGGSTLLPTIRHMVSSAFSEAKIIEIDKFGAVAKGLAAEGKILAS